jgi:putative SOS response-associated peptidase YedK
MIQPAGSIITYLAGLYTIEERNGLKLPVYAVLTREPGESIAFIHDRMPVILGKETVKAWMGSEVNPAEIVKYALTNMYYEKAP